MLKKINTDVLKADILLIFLALLGIIRSLEWIDKSIDELKDISPLYTKMSVYFDVQTMGWFLFTSSLLIVLSVFLKRYSSSILLIIGASIAGSIHLLFGLLSVNGAEMFTTYYTNLSIAIIQFILVFVGVIKLWKKQSKNKK